MSLWDTIRAGLVAPLLLVVVLAGALGFVVARQANEPDEPARVGTITTRGAPPGAAGGEGETPTPEPSPTPSASPAPGTTGGGGGRGPSCPVGCECEFPSPGGIQIRCQGTSIVTRPGTG